MIFQCVFRGQQKAAQEHEDLLPPLPRGCKPHLDTCIAESSCLFCPDIQTFQAGA